MHSSLNSSFFSNVWKDLFHWGRDKFQMSFASQIIGAVFVLIVIYGNFEMSGMPFFGFHPFDLVQNQFRINQGWGVFRGPGKYDGWYLMEATLNDSSTVELIHAVDTITWQKPEVVSATYPNHRVGKYSRNLRKNMTTHRKAYLEYKVRKWDQSHDDNRQVAHATFWYMKERILPDNKFGDIEKIALSSYAHP